MFHVFGAAGCKTSLDALESAAPAPAASSWLRLQTAAAAAAALQHLMLRGRRELPHARESAGAGFRSDAMRDGVQEGGGRARGLRLLVAALI